jgi:general stress protein 26
MHKKNTDYAHIHSFLKKHPMGILSTVGVEDAPWGAAVYYLSDEDFNIYFVARAESLKYLNIQKNPYAALTIADSESQITVQLSGPVTTMPVQKYMDVFFDKFAKIRPEGDYQWAPPIDKVHEGNYMPLQLAPTKMQYADYGSRRIEVHGNYIEQIIPTPK